MKKTGLLLLLCVVLLTGCSISHHGEDLTGFVEKMNDLNEAYLLTAEGFVFSEEDNSIYKFFVVDDEDVLLSFSKDTKGRLTSISITTNADITKKNAVFEFCKNALSAFIDNDSIYNETVNSELFNSELNKLSKETVKIKSGNVELLLDVTTLGTVITAYKDI